MMITQNFSLNYNITLKIWKSRLYATLFYDIVFTGFQ